MADTPLTLVVLAAGIGSRYGGVKQMDPVGPSGEIIIDYSVYDALRAGFNRVVFVISAAIQDAFRERVGRTIEGRVETAYVVQRIDDLPPGWSVPAERRKPWGTAHAVLAARDVVSGPFSVINADDFYGRTAYAAVADHLTRQSTAIPEPPDDYCMVGYRLGNTLTEHGTVARGVCTVDARGYLISVRERTRIERYDDAARDMSEETPVILPLDTLVSMSIWGFTPGVFPALSERFLRFLERHRANLDKVEFFLPDTVGAIVADGVARVKVLETDEVWHGVTYAADKPGVHTAIRGLVERGAYPANLWGQR